MIKLIFFLFIIISQSVEADIKVNIDRDPAFINESFQLIFTADNGVGEPDFSPLNESFDIINRRSEIRSQLINGSFSSSKEWILSVFSKKTGKIKIPAIKFGSLLSPSKIINVIDSANSKTSSQKKDIFVEISTDTTSSYVQAQFIYVVKLYISRATKISNASLSEPVSKDGQIIINKLGDDISYESIVEDRSYEIVERKYAIFPQKSGKLTINPIVFKATSGANNIFSFDLFSSRKPVRSIVRRSKEVVFDVKPIPNDFPNNKTWLPAKDLNIQEQWSTLPDNLKQESAETRTLVLSAVGLPAASLPAIEYIIPKNFKNYPENAKLEDSNDEKGIVGIRKEKMVVIAMQSGDYVIPEISIPWWNTKIDKLEYLVLPERYIKVKAITKEHNNTQQQVIAINNPTKNTKEGVLTPDESIHKGKASFIWKLLSLFMFLLWLLTLFIWWFVQRKPIKVKKSKKNNSTVHVKALKKACYKNNSIETRNAILNWSRDKWPNEKLSSIIQIKEHVDVELQSKLDELDNAIYGKNNIKWDGDSFYKIFKNNISYDMKHKDDDRADGLEPLYKTDGS